MSLLYHNERRWLSDILWLSVLISLGFGFLLGSRALNVPDEGRYCEIARQMLISHNFITPHINGIKYFEKPPLFYWMQAGALKIGGLNEWSCRLMDALMGLIGCLATYATARKIFDRPTGLYASIILASSLLYFSLARVVTLDMTVSIWLTLSLYSFILGLYYHKKYYYGLYVFAGLAVLTKGLIGIIFPGSIIFLWFLLTKSWSVLRECKLISGSILFLMIALPWHILVQLNNPEFFHFYFIEQQFNRYLTLEAHRYQPDWFYLPILLLGLFPWTGFLGGMFKKLSFKNPKILYFFVSALFIFIFFSFSHSKLVPYILPCFPFIAILIGHYFACIADNSNNTNINNYKYNKYLWAGFITISLISISIVIAIAFFLTPIVTTDYRMAKIVCIILSVILIFNAVFILIIFGKKGFKFAFKSQLILSILFLFLSSALCPYIYMDSIKNMALILKPVLKPDDKIISYDFYYQDLPFYLNRNVIIVNWKGELEFGSHYSQNKSLMINEAQFWKIWDKPISEHKIYMMLPKEVWKNMQHQYPDKKFYLFAQDKKDVLVINQIYNIYKQDKQKARK